VGFTSSSEKAESGELKRPRCGTINQVDFQGLAGIRTIFCKRCGEEIKLTSDLTLVCLELKREEDEVKEW